MTKREIVYKALQHEETHRLPYSLQFTGDTAEMLKEHFDTSDLAREVGNYLCTVSPPWWGFCTVPEDFQNEPVPETIPPVQGRGSFEEFVEHIQNLRKTTDCYILVVIYAFNFEKAWMLRGMENLMVDMIRSPEFVEKLFGRMLEINKVMLRLLTPVEGIDGFMLGSDWGGQQGLLISPKQWRHYIRHTEAECYEIVRESGKHLWVHSCGDIEVIIPDLIEAGLQALNPVQSEVMDVQQLKSDYGDELMFWGGVSTQQIMPYGTPDEVRADTERTIDILGAGGGYVLGTSQSIQSDVPLENILAFLEVARAHG
ncbi:MAG: uroporphyrinogen decarboxylase family protein [Candidatus Brocadiia bacterium]